MQDPHIAEPRAEKGFFHGTEDILYILGGAFFLLAIGGLAFMAKTLLLALLP